MTRRHCFGLLALILAAAPTSAAEPLKAGSYELAADNSANFATVLAIVKITPKDGGVTAEVVATSQRVQDVEVDNAAFTDGILTMPVKINGTKLTFEGRLPAKDGDAILGSLGDGHRLQTASLVKTDKEKLEGRDAVRRTPLPGPMDKAMQLSNKAAMARMRAANAKDAEKKAELTKDADEAEKTANAEVPKLYQEVVDKHADSLAAATAALNLLRRAGKDKMPADDAKKLAEVYMAAAAQRGPRYESDARIGLAEALAGEPTTAPLAMHFALDAEKALTAKSTTEQQVRVLSVLALAQRKAGDTANADATDTRVAKLETELDREYLAKMPPYKVETYAGRKEKSDRVVVMELFTGAQCPPCVAADLGFDGVEKTYKPTEVVLLQYHLHIPGPDPLTNPTTEARAEHYQVHSTPSTLFNGKNDASGGGGAANSQEKYREYRKIIDKLLEKPAEANVTVEAGRVGDGITIHAKVSNLPDPGEKKRLRLALVEESIRYAGGNKLRFHHMVVRTMPGGAEGFKLGDKNSDHEVKVDLAELKAGLTKYLDESAEKRPFPKPDRPMAFKNLKVVAFVQDDETHEILQAAVADVGGEHAAK